MSAAGLEALESTLQKTHAWIHEVDTRLGLENKHTAYQALRAVLHALRDRLPVDSAAHLGSQLPMLVRGFYFEGWKPAGKPEKLSRDEFLQAISGQLTDPGLDPEGVCTAVLGLISSHVTAGEVRKIRGVLPAAIQDLWPEAIEKP